METYSRRTRIAAPLEEVWAFHSRIEGLEALTPDFMSLEIDEVRGPDGESEPDLLVEGSEIEMSLRPFGIAPRQRWVSRITEREEREARAWFTDEMLDGPFPTWKHTHTFFADGEETVIEDRVEYELPLGPLKDVLGPLGVVGFEPMFRDRHKRTHEALESGQ
ncbi:MAG: SRPBCC family protein [Halolamina sp.]|uniref:SRPBCC family protein n=1 Tax=Halolamina sp. TaxID=1940283 RepID=UPI002FC3A38E